MATSDYNPYSLEGKTILVTGASSGIGKATVERLSRENARCIMVARSEQRLKEVLECIDNSRNHIILS